MGLARVIAVSIAGMVLAIGGSVALSSGTGPRCLTTAIDGATASTSRAVAGYRGDQLANAAEIMNAATRLGMSAQAQTLGVMTAMGESSLHNVDHGDAAGPDSRGLFQQRDSWGTLADRMNPAVAAGLFFQRLRGVPGWQTLT